MRTCRRVVVVGVALSCLFLVGNDALAKVGSYQIHGQTYTYQTTDPQQVRMARERINAARAADQARARATAEASANPLVRIVGSHTQTAAAQADAELKRTLSTNGLGVAAIAGALPRAGQYTPTRAPGEETSVPTSRAIVASTATTPNTRSVVQGAGGAVAGAGVGVNVRQIFPRREANRTSEVLREAPGPSPIAATSFERASPSPVASQVEPTSTGSIVGAQANGGGGDLPGQGQVRTRGEAEAQLLSVHEQDVVSTRSSWRASICRSVFLGRC
jgi:hypothetical protein